VATLDQLAAEQRAIIELVVQRGRSYGDLAGMLAIPEPRVRQLAREALIELAPVSAKRVDADRRGQLADYVLGQQSSAEAIATQTHLRRSEAGRAWTSSLVDSLAGLYPDGPPEIPDGAVDVEEPPPRRERERDRRRERERERPPEPERERPRERVRGERRPLREREVERPRREPRRRERVRERPPRAPLSPEAQIAVRRRRLVALIGAVLLVGGIVVGIVLIAGGNDGKKAKPATAANRVRILGELLLNPLRGASDANQGVAIVDRRQGKLELIVQAKLAPTTQRQAYGVWLYNSRTSAVSLGAQVTDPSGNLKGRGPLPANYRSYKYIDVSIQAIPDPTCARNPTCLRAIQAHSGRSVLRGALADMRGPNQAVPGATTTAPTP
jgi:anti-sigma-K factor RskA